MRISRLAALLTVAALAGAGALTAAPGEARAHGYGYGYGSAYGYASRPRFYGAYYPGPRAYGYGRYGGCRTVVTRREDAFGDIVVARRRSCF